MTQTYRVITIEEVNSILSNHNLDFYDFDLQLARTSLAIYKLSNNNTLLCSLNKEAEHGILFSNAQIDDIKKIIDQDIHSIEVPINYSQFKPITFDDRKRFRNIDDWIKYYHEIANKELELNYAELDSNTIYDYLLRAHELYKKRDLSDSGYISTMVILGEFFRKEIKGKWILRRLYYYYSPYYQLNVLNTEHNQKTNIHSIFMSFMKSDKPNIAYLKNRLFNPDIFPIPYKKPGSSSITFDYVLLEN